LKTREKTDLWIDNSSSDLAYVAIVNISGILVVAPVDRVDTVIEALEALPGVDVHHIDRPTGRIVVTQEAPTVHDEVEGLKRIKAVPHVVLAEMVHHHLADDEEVLAAIPSGLREARGPRIPSFLIEDFVPIRVGENLCLECHDVPDQIGQETVAGDATPMPASHYRDDDTAAGASGSRFTCTLCHAPQTDAEPLVANTYRQ
jgi:nitrate reductase cytochrome c-type subunit